VRRRLCDHAPPALEIVPLNRPSRTATSAPTIGAHCVCRNERADGRDAPLFALAHDIEPIEVLTHFAALRYAGTS